jgi:hypothetical protein
LAESVTVSLVVIKTLESVSTATYCSSVELKLHGS